MLLRYACLTLPAAFAMLACAGRSNFEVRETYDRAEGVRRIFMVGNLVGDMAEQDLEQEVYLNALRLDWRTGETVYFLVVRLNDDDWLKIPQGESLVLLVDGSRMSIWGEGSEQKRDIFEDEHGHPYHTEQAWFQVTTQQLYMLARADQASLELKGEDKSLTRHLARENLQRIRAFVAQNVGD